MMNDVLITILVSLATSVGVTLGRFAFPPFFFSDLLRFGPRVAFGQRGPGAAPVLTSAYDGELKVAQSK